MGTEGRPGGQIAVPQGCQPGSPMARCGTVVRRGKRIITVAWNVRRAPNNGIPHPVTVEEAHSHRGDGEGKKDGSRKSLLLVMEQEGGASLEVDGQ